MAQPAQQPKYRAVIVKPDDTEIEFEGFTELQYSHYLNRGSTASIKCPVNYVKVTPQTTSVRKSWLKVYRKDSDSSAERLIWYGLCYKNSLSGNEGPGTITTYFESIANLLGHRYIDDNYSGFSISSATDQSQILWDLIDDSQNLTGGSWGITQGVLPTSKNRTATTELQYRSIKDVLESYSEVIDGVDWEFTPTPKNQAVSIFNTYYRGSGERYHKGSEVPVPLVYWVDNEGSRRLNNVSGYQIDEDGKDYANKIRVIGATIDEATLTGVDSNSSAINDYNLFDDVVNESSLQEQSTIDDRATEELNSRDTVPVNIKLTLTPHARPRVGSYDVGDLFNVKFKHYQARQFEAQYRLYGMVVTVDSAGVERTELDLGII